MSPVQQIGRACKENLCAYMYKKKKKKKEKKSGYLQPAVSRVWRKPAVNGYRQKKNKIKKKLCLSVYLLNDYMRFFLQDYTVSHLFDFTYSSLYK